MESGAEALSAVCELERRWVKLNSGGTHAKPFRYVETPDDLPPCPPEHSFDVVVAGGGLGLITGLALAQRGFKVMVFDRDKVGAAHREWNISERELAAFQRWGIFTPAEMAATVARRYSRGVISFSAEETGVNACPLELEGVLDVALDAQALLDLARRRFTEAGGVIKEGRAFRRLHIARKGEITSVFEVSGPTGSEIYRTRLAVDTMGSVSPIAVALNGGVPFDGVCPTAGTIVKGIDLEHTTGDVLVTVTGSRSGRQLIWEGFPGHEDETTVYLFYYSSTGREEAGKQSLLALFEQYYALLPTYKELLPTFRHLKPVFGYIPARHGRPGRNAARGLLCLGDSAAGQSPLTFCGFGSFVRHIGRVASLLDYALESGLLEEKHLASISPHQANLGVAWVFSRFMQPWRGGGETGVNRLMNIFCRALQDVGPGTTLRFLQDRYSFGEYLRIMLTTARYYPGVFALTARVLGPQGLARWAGDITKFAFDGACRTAYRLFGRAAWQRLEKLFAFTSPAISLKMRALRSAWLASE